MFAHTKNILPLLTLFISGYCKYDFNYETYNDKDHIINDQPDQHLEYHTFNSGSVKFYLYTSDNEITEITPDNKQLLNMSRPTKIIIHGINGYQNEEWIDQMVANYHTKGDYNVVAVDWSKISSTEIFYAVSAVNDVGEKVAEFVMEIIEDNVELLADVHLIGSSVGAHVGGAAGEKIAQETNKTVSRITALDPDDSKDLEVLDGDDAEFVDVIHSSLHMGERNYGTVDFYVTSDDPFTIHCINGTCGSPPAHDFYVLSILEADRFEGVSCKNATLYVKKLCRNNTKAPMGEAVPRNISGSFYVSTDAVAKEVFSVAATNEVYSSHKIIVFWGFLIVSYVMGL